LIAKGACFYRRQALNEREVYTFALKIPFCVLTKSRKMSTYTVEHPDSEFRSWLKIIFEEKELQFLRDEVNRIKNSSEEIKTKMNSTLAGNIEKEYRLSDNVSRQLETIVLPACDLYINKFPQFTNSISILTQNLPFSVTKSWVNFQKKHEFNPIHDHAGLFSFVIWLQIPYLAEDEMRLPWVINSNSPRAGQFEFITKSENTNLITTTVKCSKECENTMLFFPASTCHCVYPFYTSNEERITVSGNIFLNPNKTPSVCDWPP
jgi:hypothetical protein